MKSTTPTRDELLRQHIMEAIVYGPSVSTYTIKGQRWYVVALNQGHYIHHTWQWSDSHQVVEFYISPHVERV